MKYLLLPFVVLLVVLAFGCKTRPQPSTDLTPVDLKAMDKMWKTVDSLEQKGLAASALEEVRAIKQMALAGKVSDHLVKAVLYENRYLIQLEEDSAIKALERAEQDMDTYPEPARSVMHSLAAHWYTSYLDSHLWEMKSRTEYGGPAGPDIRTWGVQHFVEKIRAHYKASVQWEGLKHAEVGNYAMLLTEGQGTDELRPVLYDILVHRALDFYMSAQSFVTRPAYDFILNDPAAFAPAALFVTHEFATSDSTSEAWQALQWFKELLTFRLADKAHEAAILDADLKRLRFVYDEITIDGKDSLYQKALLDLSVAYKDNPESALIDYYRAQVLIAQASQWSNDRSGEHRYAYNDAFEICNKAITRFPESYGASMCKTLVREIEQKSISASVESINLPGEQLLTKIDYRNVSGVYMKVVRLPESPRRWRGDSWDNDEMLRRLNNLQAVKSWRQSLDDGKDHQPHNTEIGLPAMQTGHYALLVSDQENFEPNASTTGAVMYTVTELAYTYLDNNEEEAWAAIVHRGTGQPLQGVKVEFLSYEYNSNRRQQQEVKLGEAVSDINGWVQVPEHANRTLSLRLTKGNDELFSDDTYYTYRYGRSTRTSPATFFFTDRSIYRPGQKIYFKGYAVDFDPDHIPTAVSGHSIDVTLFDVNGKEVEKQSLRTNEYGTFFGYFDLPLSGLTGQMSIASSHGSSRQYFRVEEYKRPKFEVTFDTLDGTVRLGDSVTVRAYAKDYAGSAVSGAMAGYRVERVAYRPWWGGFYKAYWPSGDDRQVLSTGQLVTALDGSMDIRFVATGKPGSHPDLYYRFEVTTYVTDITGESHEATKSLVLNRQGYEVTADINASASADRLKAVRVTAYNADNQNVKVAGEVEVSLLKGPSQNKRSRLWALPDIMSLTESEYMTSFPNYFSPGLEEKSAWPIERKTGKKQVSIDGEGTVDLSTLFSMPGYYKLEWNWKDATGQVLNMTQYIMVYSRDKSLPGFEVSYVDHEDKPYEPGDKVRLDLLTGIPNPPKVLRITDHRTGSSERSWINLPKNNDQSVMVTEKDRGGIIVHHMAYFNNRFFQSQQNVSVPWSNKELTVSLKTWRDKMEPGDDETWTLTVEGQKQEKVIAEMLLSMYDASLDAFLPHQWSWSLYPATGSRTSIRDTRPQQANYWGLSYHWDQIYQDPVIRQYRDLNTYGYYPEGIHYTWNSAEPRYTNVKGAYMDGVALEEQAMEKPAAQAAPAPSAGKGSGAGDMKDQETTNPDRQNQNAPPPLRSALDETVFFYPQMMTDSQGRLTFQFKMKEGLTRWKFQALAHTKELAYGLTGAEVVTQKSLMVFPNPPRFFREGDTIAFQVKVSNLTDDILDGKARLKILNAFTDEDVSSLWGIGMTETPIQIGAKGSVPASWNLKVPAGWTVPVKYQVSASAGAYADGEESFLPVVTNRILITESLPLPVKANESKTFVFKSMLESRSSTTIDQGYTVEMTTSPAWYAVQALPYLMEYPHECAEQTFSRLYANTLASYIANSQPSIRKVYDAWRKEGDDALVSNLSKNQELKSAMLEETPWVRDAMGETRQKKEIVQLFEPNRLRYESQQAVDRLRQMQLSNGGFPWFPGGQDNWYITQYIVEGFGHLQKMGVTLPGGTADDLLQKSIPYIDARMIEWYTELKSLAAKGKLKLEDHQAGSMQVHYLYTRSFYPDMEHPAGLDEVISYLHTQCTKYWLEHGLYDQGLIALASFRMWPADKLSKDILASLRERTIFNEELGRYWKLTPGYQWNEAAVELQSLMVELYQDMGVPQAETDELRVWLLKQKQTTQWKTTKATAAAIYALLIHPDSWLSSVGVVQVKVGGQEVIGNASDVQAGTGYIKQSWDGKAIQPSWSTIAVSNPNNHIAWGSVYWQYWEDLDKVKSSVDNNPLKISRALLIIRDTDRGEVTEIAPGRALKVGDKLIVRLTIETDRAMDYVHLRDVRASGFEPVDVLSGYRWKGGLGYYQSTKDLATHFFIDHLPRGKFVIEYPVTIAQAGAYSEGLATLQCMYAPEFGGHSAGSRVMVKVN